ncbi:YfeC-like transcriptional regulator [Phytobacter massiliensis]|uniref:YfeC-like transcriptional regulator n=1 Tax=Phytobacter massiliensis TaxID=1485952 RepID=UPI0005C699D5|nr:YfeC-like transcriptional regulator [Phytobacter massiliensis]
MKLPTKMTTEELADFLGVAKQTVNRWIREQKWTTESLSGVKGGRARLIHIDKSVRSFIMKTPSMRHRLAPVAMAEPTPAYDAAHYSPALRKIVDVLQNMTPDELERLGVLLSREGIRGFMHRLGINDENA